MQPLLEPALLVSDNCRACRGTGRLDDRATPIVCEDCEGAGREVREVPLSEVWAMAQRSHETLVAPPPSMVREEALAVAASPGDEAGGAAAEPDPG